MRVSIRMNCRVLSRSLCIAFAAGALAACAKAQMDYNVMAYDNAIADTANQLLLLNAVRASQHYPRSFTSVGQVQAAPPLSANFASTLNFTTLAGLQTYSVNPSTTATAGYGQFMLGNLNTQNFMQRIRAPIDPKVAGSFRDRPAWPRQILDLVYIQSFEPTEAIVRSVDGLRRAKCGFNSDPGSMCARVNEQIADYRAHCNGHFDEPEERVRQFRGDPKMYFNTAVNFCHYARFRIFLEEAREARLHDCDKKKPVPGCLSVKPRTALEMIGYLGELIAAQNYIPEPFVPKTLYGLSVGPDRVFVDVPLFEVRRGEPLESAAVIVHHEGMAFYIPRPNFGAPDEARSLQTLELVLETVQAATQETDVPKVAPAVSLIKN